MVRLAKPRSSHAASVPVAKNVLTLTRGQVAWLMSLTPAQRSGLRNNPRLERMLLDWFRAGGDPILQAEASRLVQPLGKGANRG